MSAQPEPLLACHCTVGAGLPVAATVKEAVEPAFTLALDGCVVTAGAVTELEIVNDFS